MGIPVEYCAPWTTPDKLCCPDAVGVDCETGEPDPAVYAWTDEELIEAASGILFRATCRLYPGHCQITVRPCGECGCNRHKCGCGRYPFVTLQEKYPIISVDEVLVDGVVVPAGEYRVDDYQRLVRLDGTCWPSCNDLIEPATEPNTFQVTYTAGRLPPIQLQMAAAELACELKRACNGLDCGLPGNVTSVSRQGVSFNIDALEAHVGAASTGISAIDAAIRQYDCKSARSRVWHPSLPNRRGVYPS